MIDVQDEVRVEASLGGIELPPGRSAWGCDGLSVLVRTTTNGRERTATFRLEHSGVWGVPGRRWRVKSATGRERTFRAETGYVPDFLAVAAKVLGRPTAERLKELLP